MKTLITDVMAIILKILQKAFMSGRPDTQTPLFRFCGPPDTVSVSQFLTPRLLTQPPLSGGRTSKRVESTGA